MRKVIIRRKEAKGFLLKETRAGARVTIGSMWRWSTTTERTGQEKKLRSIYQILSDFNEHLDWPAAEKTFQGKHEPQGPVWKEPSWTLPLMKMVTQLI